MTSNHAATAVRPQSRGSVAKGEAVSKIITAGNLLARGEFRLFLKLLRRSMSARLSDQQAVRVGDIRYRMYASTPSEYDLIEDGRELALLGLVRPGQFVCIYDVGANIGLHSIYYSHVAKQVVCFEPQADNYARLAQNIKLNQRTNIEAYPLAISDVSGTVEFLVEPGVASQVNMLSHPEGGADEPSLKRLAVESSRLDDLNLPPPDLIKIDVEGAEMKVLFGARNCLERWHPTLHLEVHAAQLHLFDTSEQEIREFLTKLGYSIEQRSKGGEQHYICTYKFRGARDVNQSAGKMPV